MLKILEKLKDRFARGHGLFSRAPAQDVFTNIYKSNLWENDESASGPGSTLEQTANIRSHLPKMVKQFDIKTILDAPCGDFNWMKLVLPELDVTYIGGDIVEALVTKNAESYATDCIGFEHLNLISDPLPEADLLLCRDCLFHLSRKDTKAVLENFVRSEIGFLLTTSNLVKKRGTNRDIATGGFRTIDLFAHPYNFPDNPLYRFDDYAAPVPPREMCLWSREQIIVALDNWNKH